MFLSSRIPFYFNSTSKSCVALPCLACVHSLYHLSFHIPNNPHWHGVLALSCLCYFMLSLSFLFRDIMLLFGFHMVYLIWLDFIWYVVVVTLTKQWWLPASFFDLFYSIWFSPLISSIRLFSVIYILWERVSRTGGDGIRGCLIRTARNHRIVEIDAIHNAT